MLPSYIYTYISNKVAEILNERSLLGQQMWSGQEKKIKWSTVDFEMGLKSLYSGSSQLLFHFSFFTNGLRFAPLLCWTWFESISPSTLETIPIGCRSTFAEQLGGCSLHEIWQSRTNLCRCQPESYILTLTANGSKVHRADLELVFSTSWRQEMFFLSRRSYLRNNEPQIQNLFHLWLWLIFPAILTAVLWQFSLSSALLSYFLWENKWALKFQHDEKKKILSCTVLSYLLHIYCMKKDHLRLHPQDHKGHTYECDVSC